MATAAVTRELLAKVAGQFAASGRVVIYDGVCNLCNAGVRFVAARDPDKRIMFCSAQSHAADKYLAGVGLTRQQVLKRFVFIEYKDVSAGSTAALRVAHYMQWPWPLVGRTLMAVPLPVRDAVYDFVAQHRYSMFGRTRECQVPHSDLLDRFIDRDELAGGRCSPEGMGDVHDDDGDDADDDDGESGGQQGSNKKDRQRSRGSR